MKADTQRRSVHSVHQEEEDSARKASIAFSQRKNELNQSGLARLTHPPQTEGATAAQTDVETDQQSKQATARESHGTQI